MRRIMRPDRPLYSRCSGFSAQFASPAAAEGPIGPWEGAIPIMGQELDDRCPFQRGARDAEATIDIPQQMAMGLPLSQCEAGRRKIHFELAPAPASLFLTAPSPPTLSRGFPAGRDQGFLFRS